MSAHMVAVIYLGGIATAVIAMAVYCEIRDARRRTPPTRVEQSNVRRIDSGPRRIGRQNSA